MSNVEDLITEHFDTWTSSIKVKSSSGRGSSKKRELYGIKKLRELILDLAIRGLLVPQNHEENADELLEEIAQKKAELIKSKVFKKQKSLPLVRDDEHLFRIPPNWCWTRIGNISEIGPRNILPDEKTVAFIPMPLITTNHKGEHGQEPRLWNEIKKGYTHFADGDIALAKITPCFENSKAAVFSGLKGGAGAGTTELHVARPVPEKINSLFILIYLKAPIFLDVGKSKMTGSAGQKRVPKDYFAGNPLPFPPLEEQNRIVFKVDELMSLCDQLEQQTDASIDAHETLVSTLLKALIDSSTTNEIGAEQLKQAWDRVAENFDLLFTTESSIDQLKQTVLQLAVMGKLVPQDPSDEPASVLLEKVAAEKEQLIKEKKIKKQKPLLAIANGDVPFKLPKGWKWSRFFEVNTVKSDLIAALDYPNEKQVAPDSIEKNTGRLIAHRTVAEVGIKGPNNRFSQGQLLYSKIRPSLNKVVIAPYDGLCSADMYPIDSYINSSYVLYSMLSEIFLVQVRAAENRVKMPKLNLDSLGKFLVPIPPLAEQQRIAEKISELFSLCDALKLKTKHAQLLQIEIAESMTKKAIM